MFKAKKNERAAYDQIAEKFGLQLKAEKKMGSWWADMTGMHDGRPVLFAKLPTPGSYAHFETSMEISNSNNRSFGFYQLMFVKSEVKKLPKVASNNSKFDRSFHMTAEDNTYAADVLNNFFLKEFEANKKNFNLIISITVSGNYLIFKTNGGHKASQSDLGDTLIYQVEMALRLAKFVEEN